jgi:hypothetical protein
MAKIKKEKQEPKVPKLPKVPVKKPSDFIKKWRERTKPVRITPMKPKRD